MSQHEIPDVTQALALAHDLRELIGRVMRRLREEVRPGELTLSQMSAIGRLDREGPATVTTLARAEGVRPQSMGATVAALEDAGLVRGAPDPADGRQTILALTPAARAMVKANRAAREDWLARTLRARLSPRDQEQLAAALPLLKRLIDP
jgi:DNA-binding MarR family transcriptional regulator